jgi:phage shock protein C
MNPRRLYRCRADRKLAGVAGGMAEYLDLDPTLVRVLWILSIFFGGFSILLYIILAFVMPPEPYAVPSSSGGVAPDPGPVTPAPWPAHWHDPRPEARRGGRAGLYVGVVLIVLGGIALADALVPGWASVAWFGPAILVALGAALLVGSIRREPGETAHRSNATPGAGSTEEDGHATPA